MQIFWVIPSCGLQDSYWCFEESECLHRQCQSVQVSWKVILRRWEKFPDSSNTGNALNLNKEIFQEENYSRSSSWNA